MRCAAEAPPVRLVGRFARRAAELEPAQALASNRASDLQLRFVSAAVLTAGDVATRLVLCSSGHGMGLRGGRFSLVEHDRMQVAKLDGVRWTEDVAVSGTLEKTVGPEGRVQAHLQLAGADALDGVLDIVWNDAATDAVAEINGSLGGVRVAARMQAP